MRVSKVCLLVLLLSACYRDPAADRSCWDEGSCGWTGQAGLPEAPPPPPMPSSCFAQPVDPLRSLMIVEPTILHPQSGAPSDEGSFGFDARIRSLAASEGAAQALTSDWLHQFSGTQSVPASLTDPYATRVEVAARPDVAATLECPWLRLDASNACDATCGSCRTRNLDLRAAPFALLAIVNRMDLAVDQSACSRDAGELRLVYTAVVPNGQRPLPLTVIFEYKVTLPPSRDRAWYAGQWQQLSLPPEATIAARMQAWLLPILQNATLARVRTNEQAFGLSQGLPWELRQFEPVNVGTDRARLVQTRVPQTPPLAVDNTHELLDLIAHESTKIVVGDNHLPDAWMAGSAVLPTSTFAWQAIGADPIVRQAFNRNTCNGCHGAFAGSVLGFQHIGPGSLDDVRLLPAKLSTFLHNPGGPEDELRRRKATLQAALCSSCAPPVAPLVDAGTYDSGAK